MVSIFTRLLFRPVFWLIGLTAVYFRYRNAPAIRQSKLQNPDFSLEDEGRAVLLQLFTGLLITGILLLFAALFYYLLKQELPWF